MPRWLVAILLTTLSGWSVQANERTPIMCSSCAEWNRPERPFRVFGNTYYVGTHGLAAVLVTSPAGHILFDGDLPQSVPLIEANIRALGFRVADVKVIASSHAHFDHAGGIAALAADSGAKVVASAAGARALRAGQPTPDDPQAGLGPAETRFAPVHKVSEVADGQQVTVGPLTVTAHLTPGHTPGSTTWTFKSCQGKRCLDMVYGDSLNAVSAPGFRFSGGAGRPDMSATFRASIAKLAALPCDVLLSVHPGFSDTFGKAAHKTFVDPQSCRRYAAAARHRLDVRLAAEKTGHR